MIGFRFFTINYKCSVLISLFCLLSALADAQTLKIKTSFDTTAITIGDQTRFRIEIDQPKNARVQLPELTDTLTGKISILKTFSPDTTKKADNWHIRIDYLISCFDSGFYQVKPIAFPFEMGEMKDTIKSSDAFLKVNTVPLDTSKDVRDIKPPITVPISFVELIPYILIVIAIIGIAFGIWYFIKKRRKEPILLAKKVIEPPHVIAIRELDKLRAEKLWQNNQLKEYYTRLTEIVRIYIEKQFGILALEMTSEEIILNLKKINFEDEKSVEILRSVFLSADLVKFAKSLPLPDENEIHLLNTYQFVNNTLSFRLPVTEDITDTGISTTQLAQAVNHGQVSFVKKYNLLPIILFPKKLGFLYRIIILGIMLGIIGYEAIPDLLFNIQRGIAPSISYAKLKKMPYGDIPRYFSIAEAVVPSNSYVKITKKKSNGSESFRYIYYPVFPSESTDSSKSHKAYVVVKDFHATENALAGNQYFTGRSFKIEGKFTGDRITSEINKLFTDGGIDIESDAIILERNADPWSTPVCILIIVFGAMIIGWISLSFIPEIVFIRKFINNKVSQ